MSKRAKRAKRVLAHDDGLHQGVSSHTFRWDIFRAMPMGVVETVVTTFAILIANRYLNLEDVMKSWLVAGTAIGLLLSLFSVALVRRLGWSVNVSASIAWVVAAIGFGIAAIDGMDGESNALFFVGGLVLALLSHSLSTPLLSQIYRRHYPGEIRGKLFSIVGMVRAGTAAIFAYVVGVWLTNDTLSYTGLLWIFAGCSLLKSVFTMAMKPVYLRKSHKLKLLEAFDHLRTDAAFRKLICAWMLLGIGNLIAMALFAEYVSNERYGFGFNEAQISMITTTVPMLAFILSVVIWGMVYDKMEFYRLRVLINLFFIAGILVFFFAPNYFWLCAGMALHGMGKAGGNVIWSLWVTKFAPAESVGEYMSVHTFMTGLRGIFTAFIAFPLILWIGPFGVGMLGAGLMLLSSLWLIPEVKENWGKSLADQG